MSSKNRKQMAAAQKAGLRLLELVGVQPPNEKQLERLRPAVSNWLVAHRYLTELGGKPRDRIEAAAHMLYLEVTREAGPRAHMLDRLHMKMSNIRREAEWEIVNSQMPVVEEEDMAA